MTSSYLPIIISLIIGAALIYYFFFLKSQQSNNKSASSQGGTASKKSPSIVVYGTQNAGKTSLVSYLLTHHLLSCYASQSVNEVTVKISPSENDDPQQGKEFNLIDVPGAKVVRDTSQLDCAKVVLFMLDAFSFEADNVALLLYEVLTNQHIIDAQVPILVLCNKADIMLTTQKFIKKKLNVELQRLWMARKNETMDSIVDNEGSGPNASGDGAKQGLLLRSLEEVFSFDDTCQNPVEFMEVSVKTEKNMDKVKRWIVEHM